MTRMLTRPLEPALKQTLVAGLAAYGPQLVEHLEKNGLTIDVPRQGYAHYDTSERRITFPRESLERDTPVVPLREYTIIHEFAHALDFLLEPDRGPLSERADLGIAAHRTRMGEEYRPLLAKFDRIKREHGSNWGRTPGMPLARVYHEDFITVVETITGDRMSERPVRGHVSSLAPETRPTEYFADTVYCYLHADPVTDHRYTLPNGRQITHRYPPDRAMLEQRDPRMFAALERFFNSGSVSAESLRVSDGDQPGQPAAQAAGVVAEQSLGPADQGLGVARTAFAPSHAGPVPELQGQGAVGSGHLAPLILA